MASSLKWINLSAFLAMIIVNALANILHLGGRTTGQVSAEYPSLFTPAPFTFAIWGVIYIFLGIYTVMQLGMSDADLSLQRVRSAVRILFVLSCIFNIAWIFSWHFSQIGLSLIFMFLLLITLIIINTRLTIVPNASIFERLTVYGFNLYLGWITAATIANVSVYLVKLEWGGFGILSVVWTLVVIAAATMISIGFIMLGHRYFAAVAVIWAFFGIFIKHMSSTNPNSKPTIAAGAMIAIAIVIAFIVISVMLPIAQKET